MIKKRNVQTAKSLPKYAFFVMAKPSLELGH